MLHELTQFKKFIGSVTLSQVITTYGMFRKVKWKIQNQSNKSFYNETIVVLTFNIYEEETFA